MREQYEEDLEEGETAKSSKNYKKSMHEACNAV